jgi:CRP-like cAMP-binding protein
MDRESFPSRESRIEWQHQCAPKDSRPKLADALALRTAYDRGQLIYDEGDPIECWYRIVSGMARRFTVRPDGRRQIVDLLLPGDAFGFGARALRHKPSAMALPSRAIHAHGSWLKPDPMRISPENCRQWRSRNVVGYKI